MKINLYSCFNHWKKFGNIYLYSDPHFNDEEMQYLRFNYIDDEDQIKHIHSKVGRKDCIIFLGDIGDIEWVKKVRGYKVLIMGNHDRGRTIYEKTEQEPHLFDEVYEGPLFITEKIVLSHEPLDFKNALNIHGHCHDMKYKNDDNHICLCAEKINYIPVSLKSIVESGALKKIESIHRETINNAVKRKLK